MAEIFKWYCRKNLYVDYFDVQVEVVFLTSQGLWSHEHVNPIYLELDRYGYENENKESKAKARAMEFFSEYWLRKAKDQHKFVLKNRLSRKKENAESLIELRK